MAPDHRAENDSENLYSILHDLQTRSLAHSTQRTYRTTWKQWCDWCRSFDFSQWLSSDSSEQSTRLIMFGITCWRRGNSVRTILSKISHISWFHECNLGYRVSLHAGHKLAVRGMQRLSAPPARKQPITLQILQEMRRRCNFSTTHDRVLWGAALMGYYFLLRRSEYLAEGKYKAKKYIIRAEDIRFENRSGHQVHCLNEIETVTVMFTGSKTDQFGKRTSRTLFRSGSSWAYPVLAVWSLMEHCSRIISAVFSQAWSYLVSQGYGRSHQAVHNST